MIASSKNSAEQHDQKPDRLDEILDTWAHIDRLRAQKKPEANAEADQLERQARRTFTREDENMYGNYNAQRRVHDRLRQTHAMTHSGISRVGGALLNVYEAAPDPIGRTVRSTGELIGRTVGGAAMGLTKGLWRSAFPAKLPKGKK
ncbi:MAG: hypothetical protein WCS85_03550 [Candidatus Peribacteraceae bacterium]|jgi:hypothetical protein